MTEETVEVVEEYLDEVSTDDLDEMVDIGAKACMAGPDRMNALGSTEGGRPEEFSVGWPDYVMTLLDASELSNGKPTAAGLRRVACSLYGRLNSKIAIVNYSVGCAAVTCTITSRMHDIEVDGSAECIYSDGGAYNNVDGVYAKYLLATAETRAEGRAIKKLLGIKTITAEEGSEAALMTTPVVEKDRTAGGISSEQIDFIERLCEPERANCSIKGAVMNVVGPHDSINDLSHAEAVEVLKVIKTWVKDKGASKPDNVEVYDASWKSDFYKG